MLQPEGVFGGGFFVFVFSPCIVLIKNDCGPTIQLHFGERLQIDVTRICAT